MKRYKLATRSDRKRFSRTADQTHSKNVLRAGVMRGGYRI